MTAVANPAQLELELPHPEPEKYQPGDMVYVYVPEKSVSALRQIGAVSSDGTRLKLKAPLASVPFGDMWEVSAFTVVHHWRLQEGGAHGHA